MMNKQKWAIWVITLVMIFGTMGVLGPLKAHQKLGLPGVKTTALPGSSNLQVLLPENVPGFTSEYMEPDKIVLDYLPKDTSFGQRRYTATNGFWSQANVVLMGTDRTSIHKPQICLTGQGWKIDPSASKEEIIHVEQPCSYDLAVTKLIATKQLANNGQVITGRGVYVYWFVADDVFMVDPTGLRRMWLMARKLLQTGVLQRWAYVSYFTVCLPGQEEATFEQMKKLIAASVPEFQLAPRPGEQAASARP
jgi:Protein of unknown function (DUF3485)